MEELLQIYHQFSSSPQSAPANPAPERTPVKKVSTKSPTIPQNANNVTENANKIAANVNTVPVNSQLYDACIEEANTEYKKVMNARAILFKKAAADGFLDINKPDLIFDRGQLAIEVLQGWQKVSQLYDRADYVKQHGRLPSAEADLEDDNDYDVIPDSLVKQRLDNARKAYNKLKKKERTPERIALLQQHEANIKKLKAKWDSLQPPQ